VKKIFLFILNLIHVKLNKIIETLAKIILIIALIMINLQLLKSNDGLAFDEMHIKGVCGVIIVVFIKFDQIRIVN
jgi:hypothetical protein